MEKGHPTVSEAEDEVGQEVGDEISFLLLITVLLVAHLGEFLFFFLFNYLFSISNKPVVSYLSWLLNLRNIIFGKTREFRKTYLEMSLMCLKRLRAKTIKILFSPDFCFFPDLNLEE